MADIRAAGFTISELDRVIYAPIKFAPPQAHILGRGVPAAPPTA
jgi:hypothetical protein